MARNWLLLLWVPLCPVQSWATETPQKWYFIRFVLSISTPFCFRQTIKRGRGARSLNVGHLLKQCVFLISASRVQRLFPHSNVLFKISLIWGEMLLEKTSIFKNCKQGGYTFVWIISSVLQLRPEEQLKKWTSKLSVDISFLLRQQSSEYIFI